MARNRIRPATPPSQRRREGYSEGTSLTWEQRIERATILMIKGLSAANPNGPMAVYEKIIGFAHEALSDQTSDDMIKPIGNVAHGDDDYRLSGVGVYRVALDNVQWQGNPSKCETVMAIVQRVARDRIFGTSTR